jgi:nucleotide-binding universal stress UspA family protein
MKKILVPIDFSECSINALNYGVELAKITDAEIMICHALSVPIPGIMDTLHGIQKKYAEEEKKANVTLEKISQEISSQKHNSGGKIKCDFSVIQGGAVEVISDVAAQFKPDYIVIGTVGNKGWENVLGSTTLNSIRTINMPIIAVPLNAKFVNFKNVLISIDSPNHHINSIRQVRDLAKIFNSRVVVSHVTSFGEHQRFISEKFNQIKDECHKQGIRDIDFQTLLSTEGTDAIIDFVEKNNFQLIVLLKEKHSFFDGMFHKSFIKRLVMDCKKPLLVLND